MSSRAEENGTPICSPIQTLDDLLKWKCGQDSLCVTREPLQPRAPQPARPLTLVCHDMMGGYIEDRYVQSVNKANGYRFFNWQYVDLFVYFSHHFITLPPCGWIISAHKNRVPILGTMITEGDKGFNICKEFLTSRIKFMEVADKMVEIAESYNIDGWLINIENEIEENQIPHLCEFISHLKSKMVDCIPHSKVIWYDSVTKEGNVFYQNELNEKNMMFFDKCDGIFLNYMWNFKKLLKSKQLCCRRNRPYDVFVGIDVFGRGCYKGGGYNTNQALEVIRNKDLSAAIFANGWVYECQEPSNFLNNEMKFWSLLHEFCPSHCPASLPLVTSFCHGYGKKYFLNGDCISTEEWVSLGLQQLQPIQNKDDVLSHKMFLEDAYLGGGCLLVEKPNLQSNTTMSSIFNCRIPIDDCHLISYTTKLLNPDCSIILQLTLEKEKKTSILTFSDVESSMDHGMLELKPEKLQEYFGDYTEFLLTKEHNGWQQHHFLLDKNWISSHITDISIGTSNKNDRQFSFLLGQLQLLPLEYLRHCEKAEVLNITTSEHKESKNVIVEWTTSADDLSINYFNIYMTSESTQHLLGHTTGCRYVIENSIVIRHRKPIQVTVQPVLKIGFVIPTKQCRSISLFDENQF